MASIKEIDVKLFCQYPHIKFIRERNVYEGYLYTLMNRYDISIKVDENCGILNLDHTRDKKLIKHENALQLLQSRNLTGPLEFLQQLETILLQCDDQKERNVNSYDTTNDLMILKEYMELRKFFVNIHKAIISNDLKLIEIITIDESKRLHSLQICSNKQMLDGKRLFHINQNDLPKFIDQTSFEKDNSLISLYDRYKAIIDDENYQIYLNLLMHIDSNCWILEPNDKRLNYRRIVIEPNVSVTITFNSLNISEVPDLRFFGQRERVSYFEQMACTNCLEWNSEGNFLEELSKLLGIESFPQPKNKELVSGNKEVVLVDEGECAICFMPELNDKLPEIVCSYMNCGRSYHCVCLYEWFVTLNPVVSVNEISGKCPNCDKVISCPVWH